MSDVDISQSIVVTNFVLATCHKMCKINHMKY